MTPERLLILGGTGEAAELARAAAARFGDALEITTSLAGRTERPSPLTGRVRIGGFGGPAGLAAYLTEHRIRRLVDATHPFAERISSISMVPLCMRRSGVTYSLSFCMTRMLPAVIGRASLMTWLSISGGTSERLVTVPSGVTHSTVPVLSWNPEIC